MQMPRLTRVASAALMAGALLLAAGCSIHEQRDKQSGDKKVDISTPFGSIKVNTDANAQDTGWPVYPGSTIKKPEGRNENGSANVNISGPMFGVKVAVAQYQSDDSPEKVLDFYRSYMKTFGGTQLECKNTGWSGERITNNGDDDELKCDDRSHGNAVELKAGVKERQHIVAVKPHGSGSEFALVYVQTHGKQGTL